MKRLTIMLICLEMICMLCGCSKKIVYNSEYGVRYRISPETFITITVDPDDSKTISKLVITVSNELIGNSKGMESYEVSKPSDEDGSIPIEYYRSEQQEIIIIRFYSDNLKQDDLKKINEYLGYDFTTKTNINDLISSDSFKYKEIIENGELVKDISFAGNMPFKGELKK